MKPLELSQTRAHELMLLQKEPTLVGALLVLLAAQFLNLFFGLHANRSNNFVHHRIFQVCMLFDILFSISLSYLSFLMLIPAVLRFMLFIYDFVTTNFYFERIVKEAF